MSNMKPETLISLPVLLLSSALGLAATDRDAIQACSEAIADKIETEQGAGVKLLVDESGINPFTRLGTHTTFELDALDSNTRAVIGKFDCKVDRRAQVMILRARALEVLPAERQNRG